MAIHSIDPPAATWWTTWYNDSQPVTVVNPFLTTQAGWTCLGAKVWFPAPTSGTVTAIAHADDPVLGAPDVASHLRSAVVTPPGSYPGWGVVTWSTPIPMTHGQRLWLGYYNSHGDYCYAGIPSLVQAADGSRLYLDRNGGDQSDYDYSPPSPPWLSTLDGRFIGIGWGVDIIAQDPAVGVTQTLFNQPDLSTESLASDNGPYTMGMEFVLSQDAPLTAVWFYSGLGAGQLPTYTGVFRVSDRTLVASHTPTTVPVAWNGPAGGLWLRDPYDGTDILLAGVKYKVAITAGGGSGNWYTHTAGYWSSGVGAAGVTHGIISAPNDSSAADATGQDSFYSSPGAALVYPNTSYLANNYWLDVEVRIGSGGLLLAAGYP